MNCQLVDTSFAPRDSPWPLKELAMSVFSIAYGVSMVPNIHPLDTASGIRRGENLLFFT